jgi:hypothetical protein
VSDFYAPRRTLFADLGGLVGMGLGALVAAMTVWKVLATGFRTGAMERAFATFLAVVITAGALGGLAGLGVGRWIGGRWERRHRDHRPRPVEEVVTAAPEPTPAPATMGTFAARPLSTEARRVLALAEPHQPPNAVPWGVWDGPRLVAVVRVIGEGERRQVEAGHHDPGYDPARLLEAVATSVHPT